ncbi:MAG TPA: MFS transporter [Trebonia sp.]|jgi:MFS family permease
MSLDNPAALSAASPVTGRASKGNAGTLLAACLAVFVAQVANALPASLNGLFQQEFNTQGSALTWITAAFMVTVVVFEFTFGVLGDLFGRKKLVAAGAVLTVIGAIVMAVAPDLHFLWIGAGIDGLGAGAMFPGSLAMVATMTHTARTRANAVAVWAGSLSAGAAVSPLIGGILASHGGWRASFWLLAAVALVSLALTLVLAAESSAPAGRGLDVPGQVTFAIGLIAVMYATIQGPEDGWTHGNVLTGYIVGVIFLTAFVAVERKARSPILKLDLFRNRAFSVTNLVAVVSMFTFLGTCFSTSMWIGPVQHQSATRTGLLFLLLQGPAFVLFAVIGKLLTKVAPQWLLAAGCLLMAAGAFLCTRLDITDTALTPFVLPDLLTGIGFGLAVNSFTAVALNTVPLPLAGMASATTNMFRDLGFALGPVIAGAVALSHAGSSFLAALPKAGLPASQLGPALGIGRAAGPIAVNSLSPGTPGAGAHLVALQSLGTGFGVMFAVCAVAGLAAAVLTVAGMLGTGKVAPAAEALSGSVRDTAAAA